MYQSSSHKVSKEKAESSLPLRQAARYGLLLVSYSSSQDGVYTKAVQQNVQHDTKEQPEPSARQCDPHAFLIAKAYSKDVENCPILVEITSKNSVATGPGTDGKDPARLRHPQ